MIKVLAQLPPSCPALGDASFKAILRAWWITIRPEFVFPSSILTIGIPLLLTQRYQPVNGLLLVIGLIVCWLASATTASLNALGDYSIDVLDTPKKTYLTQTIETIGSANLWSVNIVLMSLNTLLVAYLALSLNRPLLIVLWLVGLGIGFAYSFEPLKLKRRSLLNPLAVIVGCIGISMLFMASLFGLPPTAVSVIVIPVFTLQCFPISLAEHLRDYEEDLQAGMITPCVFYGRYNTARAAFILYLLLCLAMALTLVSLGLFDPPKQLLPLFIAMLLYGGVSFNLWHLARLSQLLDKTLDEALRKQLEASLKANVRTPVWLFASGITLCLIIGTRL